MKITVKEVALESWLVIGEVDEGKYKFSAKVYDTPRILYRVNEGRVSTIQIKNEKGNCIACYRHHDVGWEVVPDGEEEEVYQAVLDFLDGLPELHKVMKVNMEVKKKRGDGVHENRDEACREENELGKRNRRRREIRISSHAV